MVKLFVKLIYNLMEKQSHISIVTAPVGWWGFSKLSGFRSFRGFEYDHLVLLTTVHTQTPGRVELSITRSTEKTVWLFFII